MSKYEFIVSFMKFPRVRKRTFPSFATYAFSGRGRGIRSEYVDRNKVARDSRGTRTYEQRVESRNEKWPNIFRSVKRLIISLDRIRILLESIEKPFNGFSVRIKNDTGRARFIKISSRRLFHRETSVSVSHLKYVYPRRRVVR